MIFTDTGRLARLLENQERPVQLIFAGKAHPADRPGQQVIQEIFGRTRAPEFRGRVFILEDYDMRIGRFLVQGVDVWLNNPRRPLEASGTSGMKAAMNGVVNVSVLDGWWAEAYDGLNGFAIGHGETHSNTHMHDARDATSLVRALLDEVVPLYYDRDRDGLPREWIARMKRAIRTLGWRFSAHRMVMDYVTTAYIPAAGGTSSDVRGF
jgi:starch phosphorylase